MKQDSSQFGIVYVLTNSCMKGLCKIGKTSRDDLSARMKELFTTGVPVPFECAYACQLPLELIDTFEQALHEAFAPYRVNANREFFQIDPTQAVVFLKAVANLKKVMLHNATNEVTESIDSGLDHKDVLAAITHRGKRQLDFSKIGLVVGDTLEYKRDPTVTVQVASRHKVMFENQIYSLSKITQILLDKDTSYGVRPTKFWVFNGRTLQQLFEESN